MDTFVVESISLAAYLLGPKVKKLLSINKEENNRFSFVFEVTETEGKQLLLEYANSESRKFDQAVQYIKDLVFKNPKRIERK